ncbi:hypothetical protein ONE63_000121 [Megalurothrips usitatus]|uniref:Uncharacterized protein n=1 Tax=Megalurothrips usitatus TaxID=439358 RepID=A0AAV7XY41_9NEOP|nr:hypothetical protein ONE63_000121 [Megalurothrips usitatus]
MQAAMYRGSPPRRKPERSTTLGRKPQRRSAGATAAAPAAAAATAATAATAAGAAGATPLPQHRGRSRVSGSSRSKPKRRQKATPTGAVGDGFTLADVLPTWRPTPKDDLRRADNVLLALGLKPVNSEVAERFFKDVFSG